MNRNIKVLICLLLLGITYSCSKKLYPDSTEKVEKRKTQELVDALDSMAMRKPDFFYSKIGTRFRDTTKSINFKTSLRMVKDSAMNFLITYLAIPVVNSTVTTDTLTIVNKKDRCYIVRDLEYIKDNFGVDFDYRNLEELFLGLPLDYDIEQKYFQIHDNFNYIISSHRKREIRRIDRKDKEDIVIKYFLRNDLKGLRSMEIESPSDTTSVKIDYREHEMVDAYLVPKLVYVTISSPNNNILLELSYERTEINEPQTLFLVIPEGYEPCE